MSIKKVKLTEADLNRIVRKVIKEQTLKGLADKVGLGGAYDAVAGANGKIYDTVRGAVNNITGRDEQSTGVAGLAGLLSGGFSALLNKFSGQQRQRIENIANTLNSLQTKPVVDSVIVTTKYPQINGMTWSQFVTTYKVTPEIIRQAKSLAYDMKQQPQGAVAKPRPKPSGVKKPVTPTPTQQTSAPAQMSPEQLKAIQAQAKPLAETRFPRPRVKEAIGMSTFFREIPSMVAHVLTSIQKKPVNKRVIVNPKNAYNGKTWLEYVKMFNVTPEEINNAKAVAYDMKQNAMKQPQKPAARPQGNRLTPKKSQTASAKTTQSTVSAPQTATPTAPQTASKLNLDINRFNKPTA